MSDFWKDKSVLVTGISGFIGAAVAQHLVSQGARVTGIIRDMNCSPRELLKQCDISLGSITDYRFLCEVISSKEIEYIFHFAAYAIVRISAKDPMSTYAVNAMGTVNLLEAVRNVGKCKRIIVASSDKAYGDHVQLPYTEDHALVPLNTYDASKACTDLIARSYGHTYNMPVAVTRCSNVYGPGDYNFSRIVPNSTLLVLRGHRPVLYNGIERMEREFIFIDDVVEAYDLLAQTGHTGAYNIGGTGPVKIRELVDMLCEKAGKPGLEPRLIDSNFQEISRQWIDASKLEAHTGWKPRTSLADGLERTVEWYRRFV